MRRIPATVAASSLLVAVVTAAAAIGLWLRDRAEVVELPPPPVGVDTGPFAVDWHHPALTRRRALGADGETTDEVLPPAVVRAAWQNFREVTAPHLDSGEWEVPEDEPADAGAYGWVVRLAGPAGAHLYVQRAGLGAYGASAHAFLHDPGTGRVSPRAVAVGLRWHDALEPDALLEGDDALFDFHDLDGDGRPELRSRGRVHCGTMCDSTVVTWHRVDESLELEPVMRLRTAVSILWPSDGANHPGRVHRTAEAAGPGKSRIVVEAEGLHGRGGREEIGRVTIEWQPDGGCALVDRKIRLERWGRFVPEDTSDLAVTSRATRTPRR